MRFDQLTGRHATLREGLLHLQDRRLDDLEGFRARRSARAQGQNGERNEPDASARMDSHRNTLGTGNRPAPQAGRRPDKMRAGSGERPVAGTGLGVAYIRLSV